MGARIRFWGLSFILFSLCFIHLPVAEASSYIIKLRESLFQSRAISKLEAKLEARGVAQSFYHAPGKLLFIRAHANKAHAVLSFLKSQSEVEYVVPDHLVRTFLNSGFSSVALSQQWHLERIQAQQAWSLAATNGSRGVSVAVIDTGGDYKHLNLKSNMIPGFNFINNTSDPMDHTSYGFPGHGTHCAGVIGAEGVMTKGTIGVSPVVSLMPLKFIDEEGGLVSNAIRAIDFAIAQKVDVISASWGGAISKKDAQPLLDAIERANQAGIVFVTASGNNGKDNDVFEIYPANAESPNTITVAATDRTDKRPKWSNVGEWNVDIAAPGESILSTLPGNRHASMSGTSMAAPQVAGLVALIKALGPQLTPAEIKSVLQASGESVPVSSSCNCRLNASHAVKMILEKKPVLRSSRVSSPFQREIAMGTV